MTDAGGYRWWWRLALLAAAGLALAFGLLVMFWLLARPLALLFAAIVIANALAPAVGRLSRRLPRGLAVAAVYLLLLVLVAGMGAIIVPPLVAQARESAESIPELVGSVQRRADRANLPGQDRLLGALASSARNLGGVLLGVPFVLLSAVLDIALVVVVSAYWLAAMPGLRGFTLSLFPAERRERVGAVLGEMGQTIGGYVRGTAIDGLILGAVAYGGYLLIGVRFPLVLGLLAGLAAFVPVIGPFLAAVPAVALALLDSPVKALVVIAFYFILQQLEGYILLPNVMHSQADIPPLLVILALFAGGSLGGVLGALVAIPLAGALRVLVLRLVAPAVRAWTGASACETDIQGEGSR